MASSVEPPIAEILEQASRLRLTTEQKTQLNQLELDFEEKAARLICEQQLLNAELRRSNLSKSAPLSLTSEQLALIDKKMAELRLAWLGTLENAIAVLSPVQQAKLRLDIGLMPRFEWTPGQNVEDLDARITRIVSARLKDSKVVEVETAQAIADRLFNWSKSFALAVGVPLTLGTFLLGVFGYQKYSDFTSTVSSAQKTALDQINKAAAKTGEEFEGRATKLRTGYEKLESQLRETETLPAKVQDLSNRLRHLEEIEIGGPTKISDLEKSALLANLEKYRDYMRQIGYQIPATKLNIKFDRQVSNNAYYSPTENSIVMDPRLVGDPQTMYHAYTNHVLAQVNPKIWDTPTSTGTALHAALSDYLPCSFQGVSKLGAKFVEILAKDLPSDTVKSGYLRDLQSTSKIDPGVTEPHKAGEPWAAALWEIRTTLGCSPDVAQCERADKILLGAWASPWLDQASPKAAGQHFAQAVIAAIARSGTPPEAKQTRSIFQRRGLELP
ncbi:MAG TPA: hypothetical protein VMT08_20450 [Bradyrhizobium sp.]|nr:hypothetical protein [Bradyrhizobium sp.]